MPSTPLPPAAISDAVVSWYANPAKSKSLTFHLWQHLLAAGVIRHEIDEDDPTVERLIYALDVTPEAHAEPDHAPLPPARLPATAPRGFALPERRPRA